ncbi:aldolase [Rhizobium sp. AC27/96]|uniref:aldolase/citrate lyase family protein n=1 Tax=Rhizobium TaxID=379 RepID=UPI0008286295|nr:MULTISPECIES: aldolase/citrate lyase family protein [Rhizobium]NTF45741.1 aldolase [Rhizobium rhizogenes]OCJ06966.1 aldolase [Rhizobium sp. AC27/96]
MNNCEREMLDLLKSLRQEFGAVSVKAEFEAEGTRTDELLRLIDLARRADLKVGLKIGGCEAVRDLIESKQFGVEYIIAPMVETPYALKKFIEAKNKVYTDEQKQDTSFLFNIETITAFNNLEGLVKTAKGTDGVQGGVFGRVDFAGSNDMPRSSINESGVTDYVIKSAEALKAANLELVVGGAVAIESLPELKKIYAVHLTRFETRKVIFQGAALDNPNMARGLEKTVYFELLWLKNKRDYYGSIQIEDAPRIKMLEDRWSQLAK